MTGRSFGRLVRLLMALVFFNFSFFFPFFSRFWRGVLALLFPTLAIQHLGTCIWGKKETGGNDQPKVWTSHGMGMEWHMAYGIASLGSIRTLGISGHQKQPMAMGQPAWSEHIGERTETDLFDDAKGRP